MTILNQREAAPFTTADGSQIREFLNPGNSTLVNQSLAEATLRPSQCTTLHYHPKAEEIYFILSGSGVMQIEDQKRGVGPGDAIAIPSGSKHQICNPHGEDLVFLCCCAPAYSHEDTILIEER
ncbi:cupin domain-containing protein [bacterium]|nr:MAG: cupin domain-containing protein [bacterium]